MFLLSLIKKIKYGLEGFSCTEFNIQKNKYYLHHKVKLLLNQIYHLVP